jgi:hypothetical protein
MTDEARTQRAMARFRWGLVAATLLLYGLFGVVAALAHGG